MQKNLKVLFVFISIIIFGSGCDISDPKANSTGFNWNGRRIRVFFSKPGYNAETGEDAGIQNQIARMVDSALNTVDICIYELSEPTIFDSVIRAHKRGVRVRFAGDIDNITYEGYIAFQKAGVPMRLGNKDKIMHNKYVIVDGRYVTMGSANYTTTGMFNNSENVLFFDSPQVAAYYKKDFDTMFVDGRFGLDKLGHTFKDYNDNKFYLTNDDGSITKVEVYFTPYVDYEGWLGYDDVPDSGSTRVDAKFINYVLAAKESIYFAIFAYTHEVIAANMISMAKVKGVQVFGIFDKSWHEANQYACHEIFIDAITDTPNIHIKYDGNDNFMIGNPLHGSKCHNKYMLVDIATTNPVIVTGSYNFSKAASYKGNDENFVAVSDDLELAKAYSNNFVYMYSIGRSPTLDVGGESADWHDVTVNEVMWAGSMDNFGTHDSQDKFVELKNNTARDINISGWQLTGVTATNMSYRIRMFMFKENTVIPAGGYYVLAYSTNRAYSYSNTSTFGYLYIHNPLDLNYIGMELKDKDSKVVDIIGGFDGNVQALPGRQDGVCSSMIRVGEDGTQRTNWATNSSTGVNANVATGYTDYTWASPGGAN